ncbi:MAG: PEGA domain-containing protein [Candidatus Eisenbacteria bacterium]|uniref:PEGA domain-containing protein n=1 Tax=Eiseniibacteriota bacterium TaxID=2212470 RepID=A0A538U440_UNCEI|nr:MAG: PEGA domain-containing protein [Candidatus Eisenbacteria bacterium]
MSIVRDDTERWQVSARANGEVLTTTASVEGLQLLLLGGARDFTPVELASWLQSLAQAVHDAISATPPGDPVPPMLRESLGELLFSRAKLWNRGSAPCAVSMVVGAGRIGFGWVGEASVEVYRDGTRDDSEWVSIRDAQGREARAWCGSPDHDVKIELAWSPGPTLSLVRLEAEWTAPRPESATPAAEPVTSAPNLGAIPADEAAAVARDRMEAELLGGGADAPSSGVARWLAQHLSWNRPEGDAPEGDAPLADAPSEEERTPHAGASPSPPIADLEDPLSAELSSRLDSSVADEMPSPPIESDDPIPVEVPERIPPTPEPPSLTARAIPPAATSIEPPNPAIGLSAQVTAPPASEVQSPSPSIESIPVPAPAPRRAPPRQPEWPDMPVRDADSERRSWAPAALWGGLVAALFGIGWLVGSFQGQGGPEQVRKPSALVRLMRQIGLAPPRFDVAITSRPAGAWIAVDGKDLTVKAPATLELAPGEHKVELSFPELGSSPFRVRGAKDDHLSLDAPLWGALDVVATSPGTPVTIALDGQPLGFVPIHLDSVAPGPHELRFSAPGMEPWGSTIEVRVGEVREVLAYPLQSPATGLLQVRATQNSAEGSAPLDGAHVWVDATSRGVTPLTLELPRGPHSVRVAYQKEEAPVEVIDLPGGNQRFATFEFGLRSDLPALALKAPTTFTVDEPVLISATLTEVSAAEIREMWLHVRTPENRWRRYPMTLLDAQGSVVGAAPFPVSLLGQNGQQLYYVSALTAQGDELFTEMQTARGPVPSKP